MLCTVLNTRTQYPLRPLQAQSSNSPIILTPCPYDPITGTEFNPQLYKQSMLSDHALGCQRGLQAQSPTRSFTNSSTILTPCPYDPITGTEFNPQLYKQSMLALVACAQVLYLYHTFGLVVLSSE